MDKIGFIGFGQMGGTLLRALLKFKALKESQVIVMTRTEAKLQDFIKSYPAVQVVPDITVVANACRRVFICTGTRDVKNVLETLSATGRDLHVISITAGIEMKCLESIFRGRITKIMPSMLIEVGNGITLVQHNSKVTKEDQLWIHGVFGGVSEVKIVTESQLDLAADLTSCAPAFWAGMVDNLIRAALLHSDLTEEEIKGLILPTMLGTSMLLNENKPDLSQFISRVATKGGITEEGIKVLNNGLPVIFSDLLTRTLGKRELIKQQIREQYGIRT